jgi:ligand-binding sensor domain-containing protein
MVERLYTTRDGLPNDRIDTLFQSHDGTIWMGISLTGLSAFNLDESPDKPNVRSYTNAHGLSDRSVSALAEDRDGNLWVGTESGGAMKITCRGFSTYGETDGITQTRINSILEDRAGELCVLSSFFNKQFIARFDGTRFRETVPQVPARTTFSWGWYQVTLQDRPCGPVGGF